MYNQAPERNRIASLGKRTMDNSLKIFYDQVMNTALNNPPNANLQYQKLKTGTNSNRESFYKQPYHLSKLSSNQYKGSKVEDELSKIMQSLQKSRAVSETKSVKPIQSKIQQLKSLKSSRDKLSQLAEELDKKKIEKRIVESRVNETKAESNRSKIVQNSVYTNGFVQKYGYMMNELEPRNLVEIPKQKISFYSSPTVIQNNNNLNLNSLYNQKLYSERPYSKQLQPNNITFTQNVSKYQTQFRKTELQPSRLNSTQILQQLQEQLAEKQSTPKSTPKSFKRTFKQQISFLKPTINTRQQSRKKLKRCMLAVFYMCCQIKVIKTKIKQRKSKYNPIFQGIVANVIQHTKKAYIQMLNPTVQKIKQFTNKQSSQNNSKSYLIHFNEIIKLIIKTFPSLKKLLMQDKYTRNILKLLVKQRQHIPDNYLTQFQLSRIEMSRMFGHTIKSESTCNILLITFVFIRVILVQILASPIKLQPDFIVNQIWKKTVNDLRSTIYLACLELIEQEVNIAKFHHLRGNWMSVSEDMRYKITGSLSVDVQQADERQLVTHQWNLSGAKVFRDKMPNSWELLKDEMSEWCGEIYDELKQTQFVDMKLGSKSSKRTTNKK